MLLHPTPPRTQEHSPSPRQLSALHASKRQASLFGHLSTPFPPPAFLYRSCCPAKPLRNLCLARAGHQAREKQGFTVGKGRHQRYRASRVPLHLHVHTSCPWARNRGRCPQISLLPGPSSQAEATVPVHRRRHMRCSADMTLARADVAPHRQQTRLGVLPAATLRRRKDRTGHPGHSHQHRNTLPAG